MLQSRFDRLSERLLHAGIAPRHVRRYVRELSDHFDDLVREEKADGAAKELAETRALARLGNDDTLAEAMLSRPELRSFTARFPWAVFGIGPIMLLGLSVAAALGLEIAMVQTSSIWAPMLGITPGPVAARGFTQGLLVWNTLVMYGAPLAFAWLLYRVGSQQRMRPAWIVTGVVLVCILGGFQNLIFYDTGCRGCGHLLLQSGLVSFFTRVTGGPGLFAPFPFAEGFARAAANLAIAGGFWWLSTRKKASPAMELHTAQM